jgi:LysR family transcriptional regulator, flagellar master operon regulator
MNVDAIRTFLELSRLGNFSRVAEQMHLTQSTVSARIKVLEDHLNCRLFERTPSGVSLTNSGKRFYRYAVSMQQLWQQGRQEVRLPSGIEGSIGIGVHMTMWRRFMPGWLVWMRDQHPSLALHVEADYSERLTDYVVKGILDLAVTHMPQVQSGLVAEPFSIDRLVMVAREPMNFDDCSSKDYIYVDWSYGYLHDRLPVS